MVEIEKSGTSSASLPKPLVRLCNQIAAERAKPYTVATAWDLRQEAAKRLGAGLPLADIVRALENERRAAAVVAAGVDAETPGLERIVLRQVALKSSGGG